MSAHDLTNQPPRRVDVDEFAADEFAADIPLLEGVERYDAGWAAQELGRVGRLVGSAGLQQDAERASVHAPRT